MSDLQNLYQELILDHSRTPHGFGLRGEIAAQSHQVNPTCGDEVTLQVHRADDGSIEALAWEGHGCAISQASASLLAELAEGLTVDELEIRIAAFREAMRSRGKIEPDEELLGDAAALGGVSRYVARVKCAMLAWVAVEDALHKA
ncbi:nitrogen fixation NifU-like protein [Microbacterium foliorum]|jgi:nitrogen fixation NifU-like protein|uniref:Nitrogen fixation NifU-like protein n=1 Tax=Microbacterium foliorum TaxID=104336 RepID=A0ABU1HWK4_9MICO|nr:MULTISPECIES: SUF system NifU family Fe-S cluster assembly protein [Microbacterium]AQY00629.1 iron-sulfur cluster assembly scaffold protein [Microbacterium foliorum]KIP95001.1 nitrogen fixation protein NifU [Microbacterium sp. MEJ108Y]MDR6144192.1 nitrogen fixation NifU-like protein [Microbacterium foliorum]